MWTRSLTRMVSCTVCLSRGDSAGAPGLFRVDADTSRFGSEDPTPGSCACVLFVVGLGVPASPVRCVMRHTFPVAICPPSLVGLHRAGVAVACFFLFFPFPPCSRSPVACAPCVPGVSCSPAPDALCLGALHCLLPPPTLPFISPPPCFSSPRVPCVPVVSGSGVPLFVASGVLGLGAVRFPAPCVVLFAWSVLFLVPGAVVCVVSYCVLRCGVALCCWVRGVLCRCALCRFLLRPVVKWRSSSSALLCGAVLVRLSRAPVLCSVAFVVLGGVLCCCLWLLFVRLPGCVARCPVVCVGPS